LKTICNILASVGPWNALVLALALAAGISSAALASIIHLPPGTANSGAIPIGSGTGEAPPDEWSFVPFSDTSCGDRGTTAGISFYPSSTAAKDHLLIYFVGGGYCYNYNTCYNMRYGHATRGFFGIVSNLHGIVANSPPHAETVLQNNNAADGNPFTDWSKVFVFYCTGDFHTGNNVATYRDPSGISHTINHVGYANVKKYLSRLKATFCTGTACTMPAPSQIVVAGSSAGGFGAVWNLQQIRDQFNIAASRIQIIDDVGPYMRTPYWTASLQAKMANSWWGTGAGSIPVVCTNAGNNCDPRTGGEFNALLMDLHTEFPNLRASLITGSADGIISSGFSRQTYGPPDNRPPYAPKPCGNASAGDCLPDGYEGLQVGPRYKLHGYFCTEALPDYTGSQPAGFKSFEITTPQVWSGKAYGPGYHQWLYNIPLNLVHAVDATLLSDFLSGELSGTGTAWEDHIYTASNSSTTCRGLSF
jgi:hypothetical protein